MSPPLCSVIVTTFNREKLIVKTLNSIFNQTYRPIELIIVEDGSTDNTCEVIKKWISDIDDKNFIVKFHIQKNEGAPSARNYGLSLCTGDFIQALDSDDLIHVDKLKIQINALVQNPSAQSAWNPIAKFEKEEEILINSSVDEQYNVLNIGDNPFDFPYLPSAALHRSSVFKNAGQWDLDLKRWQDLVYQVKMIYHISHIITFDSKLYFFRQHKLGRINDQYFKDEGVINGIHSLSVLEKNLEDRYNRTKTISYEVFYFYLSIYFLILDSGKLKNEKFVLKKLMYWSPQYSKFFKVSVLFILSIVLPIKLRKYMFRKYIKKH